jgi:hypothetical protein
MADTELPHLLEHVAVELMALSGSPVTLGGRTEWDFRRDGHGVFHVLLEYDDDLVAIGALKEATAILDWLTSSPVSPESQATSERGLAAPDVATAVSRLRAVRRR